MFHVADTNKRKTLYRVNHMLSEINKFENKEPKDSFTKSLEDLRLTLTEYKTECEKKRESSFLSFRKLVFDKNWIIQLNSLRWISILLIVSLCLVSWLGSYASFRELIAIESLPLEIALHQTSSEFPNSLIGNGTTSPNQNARDNIIHARNIQSFSNMTMALVSALLGATIGALIIIKNKT